MERVWFYFVEKDRHLKVKIEEDDDVDNLCQMVVTNGLMKCDVFDLRVYLNKDTYNGGRGEPLSENFNLFPNGNVVGGMSVETALVVAKIDDTKRGGESEEIDETPTVIAQALAGLTLCDVSERKTVPETFSFIGREAEVDKCKAVVERLYTKRLSTNQGDHEWILITGVSRVGKTTLATHIPLIVKDAYPDCFVFYLRIDFNNSVRYRDYFDAKFEDGGASLGARLLSVFCGIDTDKFLMGAKNQYSTNEAVGIILKQLLKSTDKEICLVVHVDEYQLFAREYDEGGGKRSGVAIVNEMIRQLFYSIRCNLDLDHKRYFIVPVFSGTASYDFAVRNITGGGRRWIYMQPFKMQEVKLYCDSIRNGMYDDLKSSQTFNITVGDTLGLPGYLYYMLDRVHKDDDLYTIDWSSMLGNQVEIFAAAYENFQPNAMFPHQSVASQVVRLALCGAHVNRSMVLCDGVSTLVGLEEKGAIMLYRLSEEAVIYSPVKSERKYEPSNILTHVIRLPMCTLRVINRRLRPPVFPVDLLRGVSNNEPWTWKDFEKLHAHFMGLLLEELSQLRHVEVPAVFRGGRMSKTLQSIRLMGLPKKTIVKEDKKQFLREKEHKVKDYDPKYDQVRLAKTGNALFDGRFELKRSDGRKLKVLWQDKFSQLDAKTALSYDILFDCSKATCKLRKNPLFSKATDVVLFLCSNRNHTLSLEDWDKLFENFPMLVVVTHEELNEYFGTVLASRGMCSFRQ